MAQVKKRQLAIPGELLAEGGYLAGSNTYKEGDKIFASRIGLVNVSPEKTVYIVAIKGCYIPSVDDFVIGKIIDVGLSGWTVDINSPYSAFLPLSEAARQLDVQRDLIRRIYNIGDVIKAKVIVYDRTQGPILTTKGIGLGKVTRGKVVSIIPTKVPRLIGREGSMIKMLKEGTGCQIIVGQNGLVLVRGKSPENEDVAILAIKKIEAEAHTLGLTDRINQLLKSMIKGEPNVTQTS